MINIVWREERPNTAVIANNWWHRQWIMFRLGLPFFRVRHATYPQKWYDTWNFRTPNEAARFIEEIERNR